MQEENWGWERGRKRKEKGRGREVEKEKAPPRFFSHSWGGKKFNTRWAQCILIVGSPVSSPLSLTLSPSHLTHTPFSRRDSVKQVRDEAEYSSIAQTSLPKVLW